MTSTFLGIGPPTPESEAVVLGAALATVYPNREPHATGGAAAIRRASLRLARFVGHHDFDTNGPFAPWHHRIADGGDIDVAVADPGVNRQRISDAIAEVLGGGAVPVLLGGDDSVAEPFVAGWGDHGPVTVVQIDAHLDFRDEVDGETHGYSSPMRRASEMDHVQRIIHIGQRGVGSARPSDVADSLAAGNVIITSRELRSSGAVAAARRLDPGEAFVIVYDVDGTDPSELPAVRAPVAGGPGIAELGEVIGALVARGRLAGLVITEFEPELDPSDTSALALARLACRALDGRFDERRR